MSFNQMLSDRPIPSPPRVKESIVVEGRDDSAVVRQAVSADIIITNGFTIRQPVARRIIEAAKRKGVIVLTDPDHAGERIRRKIEELLHAEYRCARELESLSDFPSECQIGSLSASSLEFESDGKDAAVGGRTEATLIWRRTSEQEKKSRNGTGTNDIRVPRLKHARLLLEDALKDGDIGVENATPALIFEALVKAGATFLDDVEGISNSAKSSLVVFPEKSVAEQSNLVGEKAGCFIARDLSISSSDLLALGLVGAGSKNRRKKVGRHFGIGYANAKQLAKRLAVCGIGLEELRAFLEQ